MLKLSQSEYLSMPGLDVMLGQDFYPEGHQGGVVIIQNGRRVASNGDIRLEPCPGQWQPVPRQTGRSILPESGSIRTSYAYPDPDKNRKGFNPLEYPDLEFSYSITVTPRGAAFLVRVDLDQALPREWIGPVGFNLELFPGSLFGQGFTMEGSKEPKGQAGQPDLATGSTIRGLFPLQPNGPGAFDARGDYQLAPLARGKRLVIAPGSPGQRMTITVQGEGELELLDGRARHTNGWFIVRTSIPAGLAAGAVEWLVEPATVPGFLRQPVLQYNQVGYHPGLPKRAWVELDSRDDQGGELRLLSLDDATGQVQELQCTSRVWGQFLRFRYMVLDFSSREQEGWYVLEFRSIRSAPFRIDSEVYRTGVWQPTLEYFLPVQMCHMRVEDGYRVWHGMCHHSDALMAPTQLNHFDGYLQGPSTLCAFQSGQPVPGLNKGGWHDAGDFDLRIESQAGTVHGLALAREVFGLDWDNTRVDQDQGLVVLRSPDGIPDILQQIEHGLLSIIGGWKSLGRLYRGIVEADIPDYVLLGDPVNHRHPRLVFTQDNPWHELGAAAALAAASRVMGDYRPDLAQDSLACALEQWARNLGADPGLKVAPAVELLLCHTRDAAASAPFAAALLDGQGALESRFAQVGPQASRVLPLFRAALEPGSIQSSYPAWADLLPRIPGWISALESAARLYRADLAVLEQENPYGVPYKPHIWGAGWGIQHFGVQLYWLNRHLPHVFEDFWMHRAFDFVLGCHPGENNASLVSGVGARSVTTAYGLNRADWSHIPGGSVSGTALIRPDLPELLDWPYLWQQTEYVLGGGTTDWLFLALAVQYRT